MVLQSLGFSRTVARVDISGFVSCHYFFSLRLVGIEKWRPCQKGNPIHFQNFKMTTTLKVKEPPRLVIYCLCEVVAFVYPKNIPLLHSCILLCVQKMPYGQPTHIAQKKDPFNRLYNTCTLASGRREAYHFDPQAPNDSLDFILKSTYNNHREFLKDTNETLVQAETLNLPHSLVKIISFSLFCKTDIIHFCLPLFLQENIEKQRSHYSSCTFPAQSPSQNNDVPAKRRPTQCRHDHRFVYYSFSLMFTINPNISNFISILPRHSSNFLELRSSLAFTLNVIGVT